MHPILESKEYGRLDGLSVVQGMEESRIQSESLSSPLKMTSLCVIIRHGLGSVQRQERPFYRRLRYVLGSTFRELPWKLQRLPAHYSTS